jgi:hypothetical protein
VNEETIACAGLQSQRKYYYYNYYYYYSETCLNRTPYIPEI